MAIAETGTMLAPQPQHVPCIVLKLTYTEARVLRNILSSVAGHPEGYRGEADSILPLDWEDRNIHYCREMSGPIKFARERGMKERPDGVEGADGGCCGGKIGQPGRSA